MCPYFYICVFAYVRVLNSICVSLFMCMSLLLYVCLAYVFVLTSAFSYMCVFTDQIFTLDSLVVKTQHQNTKKYTHHSKNAAKVKQPSPLIYKMTTKQKE